MEEWKRRRMLESKQLVCGTCSKRASSVMVCSFSARLHNIVVGIGGSFADSGVESFFFGVWKYLMEMKK